MKGQKHGWLRNSLAEAGHRQKDLAKAWGVDDAVVSRFIATGDPEPGLDRLKVLGRMLNLSLDELSVRMSEGLPPPRAVAAVRRQLETQPTQQDGPEPVAAALAEMKGCARRLRRLLPDWATISVQLQLKDE